MVDGNECVLAECAEACGVEGLEYVGGRRLESLSVDGFWGVGGEVGG